MTFSIYALRLRGETEVRYIGQTSRRIEDRLRGHIQSANNYMLPTTYTVWFLDNWRDIEAVKIGEAETRKEALALEGAMIRAMSAIGHRLFNRHHVACQDRIPRRPASDPRFAQRHVKVRFTNFADNPQLAAAA